MTEQQIRAILYALEHVGHKISWHSEKLHDYTEKVKKWEGQPGNNGFFENLAKRQEEELRKYTEYHDALVSLLPPGSTIDVEA